MKRTIDLIPFAVGGAIAAALLLASAARCFGLDYDTRAVVLVQQPSGPGVSATACGTLVAVENGIGLVLTVAHVLESDSRRFVEWQSGGSSPATLIGADATMDIAALVVAMPASDIRPIPLAGESEHPQAGEQVRFIGHGGGQWRHFVVGVLGYDHKASESYNSQLRLGFRPISGDSGGPIIHNGKLVGIQWGGPALQSESIAYESHATYSGVIEHRLTQWRSRYPQCPGNYCQPPAQASPQPVRPQPPATPPSAPPRAGGAGCDCKGVKACACAPQSAPKPVRECVCDKNELDAVRKELAEVKLLIASGRLKGERGEAGPQGERGPAGEAGKSGKDCECKQGGGEPAALRSPAYFEIKPRQKRK